MPFQWGGPVEVGGPTNPVGIVLSILEFIAQLFGLGQNDMKVLQTGINNTYQNMFETAVFNYNAIGFLSTAIQDAWSKLKDWLDDLRWAVIVPIIEKIQQIVDDITTWLADLLDPIITFINALYQWYKTFIYPILHIILEVISRMRVFLSILKLLGVKWAAKLDADLQRIQSWVTFVVQSITATMNTISTIIGLMTDPTGILRRDFFGGTLFSSLAGVKRASAWGTDSVSTPSQLTQISQNNALVQGDTPFTKISATGAMTPAPGFDAIKADVDAGYAGLGVAIIGN